MFGFDSNEQIIEMLKDYKKMLCVKLPKSINEKDITLLFNSVNAERIANFPIQLKDSDIQFVYKKALGYL